MCAPSQTILGDAENPVLLVLLENREIENMTDQENIFRPHLHVATFCEKVLHEQDGVLSLIRMVDRFMIAGDSEEMPPTTLAFMVVISFKSGFLRGKQKIGLRPKSPSKRELPSMEFPVQFEGDDDRGPMMAFQVNFGVEEEGVYWWDVYLNQELVTSMPLRVSYQQVRLPIVGSK